MLSKVKKFTLATTLACFVFFSLTGSLLAVRPAYAQIPVTVTGDLVDTAKQIASQIFEGIRVAIMQATVRIVAYAMRKIAYDSAVWLASGGKGQSPFAHTKSFGGYLKNVGDEAAGAAIEELGKSYGLDLCKIPDVRVDLNLRIGLRTEYIGLPSGGPPQKPSCTFSEFQKEWLNADAWKSKYGGEQLAQRFNASLSVDQTDLGIQLAARERINRKIAEQTAGETLQRQEGQGFLAKEVGRISGYISTPAQLISEQFRGVTPDKQQQSDQERLEQLLGSGDIKVIPSALSIFLNSLVSAMVKNFQEQGLLPFGLCVGDYGGAHCKKGGGAVATDYGSAGILAGRRAAEELFSGFLAVKVSEVEQYNVSSQLNNCPDNPGIYNCRADGGLIQAAQRFDSGTPVTLAEAMTGASPLLHGDWKLLPPARSADPGIRDCYQRAYCHANIKVLRQLRILPLGFEIAAEQSDPDRPWTLKQVVDGFNDCARDTSGKIIYDPVRKPFCHLIDPNWVIKVPPARCNAVAFGPIPLTAGVPERLQECVDIQSCVAYNNDGTCQTFGYCAREKNAWKFTADSCQPPFATCRSYQDSTGRTVAYLARTIDTGFCRQENVGCTAYSLTQDATTGRWIAPAAPNISGSVNTGIYLNSKAVSCPASAAGCSAFRLAAAPASDPLPIKKAPDYLGCYDTKPDAANPGIQWPETPADLLKLKPKAECRQYAAACIPEEVSCNWYTLADGTASDRVPGRYTARTATDWNDECDASCNGYAAYRELPSSFSAGVPVAYIIPATGGQCAKEEAGCTGFTNLSAVSAAGGEQVEHFSYLRPCVTPAQDPGKNFITYEGSVVGGFQLRTYRLVADTNGSPKYFYRTADELRQYDDICNETAYKSGSASLSGDCRQFNDEQGRVFYKLLSKTIPVSESCAPYRLNTTELYPTNLNETQCADQKGFWNTSLNRCELCYQNGEYKDGSCLYYGLPGGVDNTAGGSRACRAEADSCREYKAPAGNKVRIAVDDRFPAATITPENWSGSRLAVSPESTQVGGFSLEATGNEPVVRSFTRTPDQSYEVVFWAKGSVGTVTVSLESGNGGSLITRDFGAGSVSDVWREYRLGPIELPGGEKTARLVFKPARNGKLFLDNVRLVESAESRYLVKNSLNVPAVCDSNPDDNLPGEALGCRAYQTPQNATAYLKNFSYLCREQAIGCTALLDTQNTLDTDKPAVYNVWLSGKSGEKVEKTVGGQKISCQIPVGQSGCYVKYVPDVTAATVARAAGSDALTPSTVYVPADTAATDPIYLVANEAASCKAADLGCTDAGARKLTPSGPEYATTTIKNDPAQYDAQLCEREAVGCGAFSDGASTWYFKDPVPTGQKICTYRTDVTVNGTKRSGWFWKGVGVCGITQAFCTADADCSGGEKCVASGDQPCYPNYLQNNAAYGLWSYGNTAQYQNFVGECPADEAKCTELVDRSDNNRAYYYKKNQNLSQGDCNQQVSQKEGCALFDDTSDPNKQWVTSDSYADSERNDSKLVPAVRDSVNAGRNDANLIIKVARDRECGEWLQCRSSHRVWDDRIGAWKNVCDDIGRCNLVATAESEDTTTCSRWVDGKHEAAGSVLTPEFYVEKKDIRWKGMEFSGYSLLNKYPIEELAQVDFGTAVAPDWRLVRRIACGRGDNCDPQEPASSFKCLRTATDGSSCGVSGDGVCQKQVCVQSISGTVVDVATAPEHLCRAYPEKDSPFPSVTGIAPEPTRTAQAFSGVKVCNESTNPSDPVGATACECSYTKAEYGDLLTKYWKHSKPNSTDKRSVLGSTLGSVPPGICRGGSHDGYACRSDNDCYKTDSTGARLRGPDKQVIIDGSCQKKTKETRLLGWWGFCLEEDISRSIYGEPGSYPCLTWYPVDNLQGVADVNNQHPEAGFTGLANYCLKSNLFKIVNIAKQGEDKRAIPYQQPSSLDPASYDPFRLCGARGQGCVNYTSDDSWPGELQIGCEVAASIEAADDNTVAWTDRLWEKRPGPYAVQTDGYAGYLSYLFGSPLAAFGRAFDPTNLIERQPPLLTTLWCQNTASTEFRMPTVGGLCSDDDVEELRPLNSDKQSYIESRSYNAWIFGQRPSSGIYCDGLATKKRCSDRRGEECAATEGACLYAKKCGCNLLGFNCNRCGFCSDPKTVVIMVGDGECVVDDGDGKRTPVPCPYNFTPVVRNGICSNDPTKTKTCSSVGECIPPEQQNTSGVIRPTVFDDETAGRNRLAQLFAKVSSGYRWNALNSFLYNEFDSGTTAPVTDYANLGVPWNFTQIGDTDNPQVADSREEPGARPPLILPVTNTCRPSDGLCTEGAAAPPGGLTVQAYNQTRGVASGQVVINGGPANIFLKFFAFADKNHMPIRQIAIDWDDSDATKITGSIRNRRGLLQSICSNQVADAGGQYVCADPRRPSLAVSDKFIACNPAKNNADCPQIPACQAGSQAEDFGGIAGQTCDSDAFQFFHAYRCVKDGPNWVAQQSFISGRTTITACPAGFDDGCCIFTPKVQVKDNWGWCNGTCRAGGGGCYDNNSGIIGQIDQCNWAEDARSATSFAGQIVVAPNQ